MDLSHSSSNMGDSTVVEISEVASSLSISTAELLTNAHLALPTRSDKEVIAALQRRRQITNRPPKQILNSNSSDRRENLSNKLDAHNVCLEEVDESEAEHGDSSEDEVVAVPRERKISQRKLILDRIHQSHVENKLRVMKDPVCVNTAGSTDEDSQSTKWLVKQAESQTIISSPREYQVELFEKAKAENIIAVLDTGSGKTLIAVLLLRHVIEQELLDREVGEAKRISFFLVDSVALVFQQYAVLDANLDYPMEQFCGNMVTDRGSKEAWDKVFSENMVIVCTAEILNHILHYSFISMDRINLLVFDEAHHATKNHSYARIIKEFYVKEENIDRRPKIFGMTASPVDSKTDVKKAASELEALLHCRIATASDLTIVQYQATQKQEMIYEYPQLPKPFKTPLFLQMETKFKDIVVLKKPLLFATKASSELGAWISDQVWCFCITDEEARKLKGKTERKFLAQKISGTAAFEAQISQIEEAEKMICARTFPPPMPNSDCLSSKVICLMEYLRERYERETDDKCIIFVDQRYTAILLAKLFESPNIGTKHLRVGTLVGIRAGDAGDVKVSLRQQVIILRKFRQGIFNCLFATSVAEEGLDIPDCNLIIRFDLYRTVTQYIQSKGRARHTNSRYIHMKEIGNRIHTALIRDAQKNENILRDFCKALPEDRLLKGNDYDMEHFLAKEKTHRVYTEPGTGAKLTYRMSLVILANFVGSLPQSSDSPLHPEYIMITAQGKMFQCEVILPESSPVSRAMGRPHTTKQVAKCAAAFEACLLLRRGKYINEYLKSTYIKSLPAMRNALLAVSSKKKDSYVMRNKPSLWNADEVPSVLYMTVFTLSDPNTIARPAQPLAILTRSSMPQFPEFPLYLGEGANTRVQSIIYTTPIDVDTRMLVIIETFTLRIFEDVFSKEYEPSSAHMPYFLVPVKSWSLPSPETAPNKLIAWDILDFVQENRALLWNEDTPERFFEDRYLVDPWDGSRKLWSINVTHKYKPLDPVPLNTAPRTGTRKNNTNILEYSVSLWAKARARRTFKEDQPVIQAEYIPLRRNLLDDSNQIMEPQIPRACFVIPEPLIISALPTQVVAMAYLFPAIIHRVESYLVALEACDMLHLRIPPDLALEALTKDSDNTDEHSEEQIHFQRGMGKNYERLEFLGDCFLKMATSIAIYTLHPDNDEYEYHVKRMLLLCNKNLFNNALDLRLYEYIRSQSFNRRAWYPEGLILKRGKTAGAPKEHKLGDKTIADVCEALIGAALFANYKTGNMDCAVRAVTEFVASTDHTMKTFADYHKAYKMPKYQTDPSTSSQRNLAKRVEQEHPYKFKHPRILRSAFMHPSYPFSYEHVPSYQRLEFLGDSLLDMACINHLFYRYPDYNPQWLTEHKMAMVSNHFLGAMCVELGFHKHLLSFSSIIQSNIAEYVATVTEARLQAENDAIAAGNPRSAYARDFWVHTKQPPKCLPDIVEAYIGAIFIDSEYDYREVEKFFDLHIKDYFKDMHIYDTFANKHPVTHLSHLMTQLGCLNWKLHSTELPDLRDGLPRRSIATVMVHEVVIVDHEGESGRYAKVNVAKKALEMLRGLPLPEFRGKYRCDCRIDEDGEDMKIMEELGHGTAV